LGSLIYRAVSKNIGFRRHHNQPHGFVALFARKAIPAESKITVVIPNPLLGRNTGNISSLLSPRISRTGMSHRQRQIADESELALQIPRA